MVLPGPQLAWQRKLNGLNPDFQRWGRTLPASAPMAWRHPDRAVLCHAYFTAALVIVLVVSSACNVRSSPAGGAAAARPMTAAPQVSADPRITDPRHMASGWKISSEGYADQPYLVKTDDGAWVCVLTTGQGVEGAAGQHVVARRSTDQGRTWSPPVDIEPADGPEASYAVLLKVPYGRIYAFYNHNTGNVREVLREDGGVYRRVDSLGHYVFKFSDDGGRTWSARRYEVPVRAFECDRRNVYGGKLRMFWNVGRPLVLAHAAILTLHKVGAMGPGFFAQSEGCFLRSENILAERHPERIKFETLPNGDIGLRAPPGGGRVAEEQSLAVLSDGSLYCVYRTVDGWPACSYSRDGGRTWDPPTYAAYTPGGRRIKHPRAANFVWRCSNGKFLYWSHNHGGSFIQRLADRASGPYQDRNPAWLAAGMEREGPGGKLIHWSQPEILLYDDDPFIRMSYPDLIEDAGRSYITETQKNIARVHEIPPAILAGLFDQWDTRSVARAGLILERPTAQPMPRQVPMPKLPEFHARDATRPDRGGKDLRAGFSLELWLRLDSLTPGQVLLDSRDDAGKGIALSTTDAGTVQITLNDGRSSSSWDSDRGVIQAGKRHHVVIIVDGGPKIISFVVDGVLCDGGEQRPFGWGRFSPSLRAPNPDQAPTRRASTPEGGPAGGPTLRIAPKMNGTIRSLRVYNRYLRTSEAVGNYRAGLTDDKGGR